MKRTPPVEVDRDRWGRPSIDGTSYTRASTLAKALDDQSGLIKWAARMAVLGMARNPDLVALAATTRADDKRALDDIAERAKERAGATSGRDTGTSIHAATEMLDCGEDVSHLPGDLLRDALAYKAACDAEALTPVLAETFVVNDLVGAAGSFDRLLWDDAGERYVIGDIKTGSSDDPAYVLRYSGLEWATQLAIYAGGRPWDKVWRDWPDFDVTAPDQTRGVIFYIERGSGVCHPLWLDLEVGRRAAQLAADVRAIKRAKVAA